MAEAEKPKSPPSQHWLPRLVVFAMLPFLLVGLVSILYKHAWAKWWVERWTRRRPDRDIVRLVNADSPPPPDDPTPQYVRSWFRTELGLKLPWYLGKTAVRHCWLNRYSAGVLYKSRPEDFFVRVGTPTHEPPRSPFDADVMGGIFVYMTNRSGGFSFMAAPGSIDVNDTASCPFPMGYTSLWICEHLATMPCQNEIPKVWPPLAHEQYPNGETGQGEWVVFRDPTYSKHREASSAATIVGRFPAADDAFVCARDFTAAWQIATVAARIARTHSWH